MKTLAVLLPTYNAAHFLNEAIDSILVQTYGDFQLYIFDDCSTDNTKVVIESYSDSRINYIKNDENLGLARTLNKGVKMLASEFTYLARMDADDYCFPERFKRQVEFLEQNKEFALCGTQGFWLKNFEEQAQSPWKYPSTHGEIKYHLLFSACFGHSSVMFRSEFLVKNEITYNENIKTCEDWDLWTKIIRLGKVANLPDFLLKYRIVEYSNHRSQENRRRHLRERSQVIANHWNSFGINCDESFVFNVYFNENRNSKSVLKSDLSRLIDMSNQLIERAVEELDSKELSKLKYRLIRNIKRNWVQSKISSLSIDIWLLILQKVRFSNAIYVFKTMIR